MTDIKYTITFFSNWHCGSGLAAGTDVDELVIKYHNGLPYVPGRTIKGLLREAAMMLSQFIDVPQESINRLFGLSGDVASLGHNKVSFTNATLSDDEQAVIKAENLARYLYQSVASTAIGVNGIAKEHLLRKIETTIPCVVHGQVLNVYECDKVLLLQTFKWVKRIGLGRNRGYGRCVISEEK